MDKEEKKINNGENKEEMEQILKEVKEIKKDFHDDSSIENIINNNPHEKIKGKELEDPIPPEIIELIEQYKKKESFTSIDFERYKSFKKIDMNFSK